MATYKNGNYNVSINLETGTKIRYNSLDFFDPEYPESMDIKICNKCDMGCPYCHEDSTPNGPVGDILNAKFIETLHPYTELAIGGGNPLEHPDIYEFLCKCKDLKLIPSMTVHQDHFIKNIGFIRQLKEFKLIYGLGVSVNDPTPELIEYLKEFPNAVVHIINGVVTREQLDELKYHNLKILILGYKTFRRGEKFYDVVYNEVESRKTMLSQILPVMAMENWFNVISFDNLAIKQLNPSRFIPEAEYNQLYMGDDGEYTMFVDLVKNEFTVSSTKKTRWPLKDNIKEMFDIVKANKDCN